MNEEIIKRDGIEPLSEILHQIADMFPSEETPVQQSALLTAEDNNNLSDTVLYLAKLGISSLVSFGAGADDKDPDTVVVQAAPPWRIGLPAKDYYNDDSVVKKYEDTLAQVLEHLYPSHKDDKSTLLAEHANIAARGQSKDYAHDVVEFEKKLAAASPEAEDRDDVTVSLSHL